MVEHWKFSSTLHPELYEYLKTRKMSSSYEILLKWKLPAIYGMFSVQLMTEVQSELMDCQSQCSRKLGMFRTDKNEDFFGSYFHYLEYGYYYRELNVYICTL